MPHPPSLGSHVPSGGLHARATELGSDGFVNEPFVTHQAGQVRWVGPAKDDSQDRFQGPTKGRPAHLGAIAALPPFRSKTEEGGGGVWPTGPPLPAGAAAAGGALRQKRRLGGAGAVLPRALPTADAQRRPARRLVSGPARGKAAMAPRCAGRWPLPVLPSLAGSAGLCPLSFFPSRASSPRKKLELPA